MSLLKDTIYSASRGKRSTVVAPETPHTSSPWPIAVLIIHNPGTEPLTNNKENHAFLITR